MFSNIMLWFTDWDNATGMIAIAGFVLSLYNLFIGIFTQRKSFRIRVYDIKSYSDVTFLTVGIENRSRLSIAITQLHWHYQNHVIPCTSTPTLLCESVRRKGHEEISRRQTYSSPLPITVSGLSAQSAFILFEDLPELPENDTTSLSVEVCTNRGRPVQMTLELPDGWAARRTTL